MSDIVERLRSMEVFFMESAGISPVAYEAAAAITTLRAALSTARADALEEAAVVCEECFDITIGAAIRSLKDREHSA